MQTLRLHNLDSPWQAEYFEDLPKSCCLDFGGGPDYGAAGAAQQAGYNRAAEIYQQMYNQARTDLKPGIDIYGKTVPFIGGLLGIPGYASVDPTATLRATPGYQFAMDQGSDALGKYAAAHGMSMSGPQMKALQTYGQGMADKNYQQYLNNLFNVQQGGQNAAGQSGQFGMNAAQGMGQAYIGAGNAQANSILAQGLQNQSGYGGILSGLGMLGGSIFGGPIGGAIGSGIGNLFGSGNQGWGTPSYTSPGYRPGGYGYQNYY